LDVLLSVIRGQDYRQLQYYISHTRNIILDKKLPPSYFVEAKYNSSIDRLQDNIHPLYFVAVQHGGSYGTVNWG